MPNRILKESICRSEEINQLSYFEEVLFYRLIVNCDDYGRFDGRVKIIKCTCFPLKTITEKEIEIALLKLAAVGLVTLYQVDDRRYLQLVTWEDHQRVRTKKSKYPDYNDEDILHLPDGTELAKPKKKSRPQVEDLTPVVITLPLNTGEEYPVHQSKVDEWIKLYPAVDVMQELRNMRGWCNENKTKRKTRNGITRFITGWLNREQNSGPKPYQRYQGYAKQPPVSGYGSISDRLIAESRGDFV